MSSPADPFSFAPNIRLAVRDAQQGLALAAWQGQRQQLTQMRIAVAEAIANASIEDAQRLYERWLAEERQIAVAASERLDEENKRIAANALQANEPLIAAWQSYGNLPFGVPTSLSAQPTQRRQQQQQQRRQRTPAPPASSARQWQPLPVLTGPTTTAPPAPPSGAAAAAAASGGATASSSSSSSSSGGGSGAGFQFLPGTPATGAGPAAGAPPVLTGGGTPPTEAPSAGAAKKGRTASAPEGDDDDDDEPEPERARTKGVLAESDPEAVGRKAATDLRRRGNTIVVYDTFQQWLDESPNATELTSKWPITNTALALEYRRRAQAAFDQQRLLPSPTQMSQAEITGVVVVAGEFAFDDDEPPR